MPMDDQTSAQIAQSGNFNNAASVNCLNPFLSASELAFFCNGSTAGVSNPNLVIARRNVEGGPRISDLEHTDIHEILGVKGKVDDVWTYDATLNWSLVNFTEVNTNYLSATRMANSLQVTGSAANPQCISGPPCVPWNIFQPGGVTQAALNYLTVPGLEDGRIEQKHGRIRFIGESVNDVVESP